MGEGLQRLARYGNAKSHTLRLLDTTGDTAAKQAGLRVADIRRCGDWLLFRHFPSTKQTKLRAANFCCTHLICGFCAIRRGARMMARYLERFTQARSKRPDLQPFLVTLTVRNGPDLRERLDHLDKCLTRLNKRRHRPRCNSVITDIAGAVWSFEVTYSDTRGWHPHVHAVWLSSEEPDQFALRREWEEITGDSFMCDVRPIGAVRRPLDDQQESDVVDPYAKGFAEVFKYALKAAELPPHVALDAYTVLRGRRLVRSFGVFYGVPEPANDELADDIPTEDLPYIDLLWRYAGEGRYEHAKTVDRTSQHREGRSDDVVL
ncbi:protein rep [Xanthomonas euvesicatoria]|nr:protein rep [Xanthomonas euvesicatoria]